MEQNLLTFDHYLWICISSIVILLITAFKTGITAFIAEKTKKFLEKVLHKEFDGKKIGEEVDFVYERLIEIKTISLSSRVSINRFHNGTVFLPSQPAWKISRVYEICSDGISYEANKFQNVMAMLIWDSIKAVFESKFPSYIEKIVSKENKYTVFKYDVEKMPESFSKVTMRRHGIKVYIQIPLINKDKVFGYLQIDYLSKKDIDIDLDRIYPKVTEISYFLSKD